MKPSDLLADPAAWTKGVTGAGRYTIIGALLAVCPDFTKFRRAYNMLRAHIGGGSVNVWSNKPARTHAEVIAALKACNL